MPFTLLKDLYQHGIIILDESLKQSKISAKLTQCYATAHYQARIDSVMLTLLLGQRNELLAKLMKKHGKQCALYITACNPHSRPHDEETNRTANKRLFALLSTLSSCIFVGKSSDPAGNWPAESSFLALGIDFVTSKTLGKQFDQNAIVWVDFDAIPRLILLR
ncbi:DUF3293 domain-containing protein [Nitrosomonas sp. Nm34]|uniref:DUF3293 domain-containing protein n=1 Tax=Nitrosomonas sp. Nm34 TaxID=1881055 RepID=UPI0008EDBF48|nr:DUF3293 domain-containing protein [Nitrosomonas sp. Nm34]SFI26133.1 Protein of unknown function [Nitrosomonas sp. Nm34]